MRCSICQNNCQAKYPFLFFSSTLRVLPQVPTDLSRGSFAPHALACGAGACACWTATVLRRWLHMCVNRPTFGCLWYAYRYRGAGWRGDTHATAEQRLVSRLRASPCLPASTITTTTTTRYFCCCHRHNSLPPPLPLPLLPEPPHAQANHPYHHHCHCHCHCHCYQSRHTRKQTIPFDT